MHTRLALTTGISIALASCATIAPGPAPVATTEHYVAARSSAPSMQGQETRLYVREVGAPSKDVVLFVHGAGTPAEVSFDVPYQDYSWMAYLARAGFDVFSVDMTGYGRSTRPAPMSDPCNFPKAQQAQFVPAAMPAPCDAPYKTPLTTMASDWDDIDAVVDHLRNLRGVDKVALVAWSQGGPRTGGYAARHPEKVSRLFVLAPAYVRDGPDGPPNPFVAPNGPMNAQSQADFKANWDRQVGCPAQYEAGASAAIFADMLASDPVGAKWGPGVRRAPTVPSWGFNRAAVAKLQVPYAMATGEHDKQVAPERVRELYDDLGSPQKVLLDLGCASHNAMWEKNHLLLFKASADWLRDGKVNGMDHGLVKLGY